jgi:CheY-like chemotaxis protein
VAILDMHMPGMDGLQLAEAIRRNPSNIKMKLVLMTSMAERGQAKRAQQLGIAAYLTKPVRQSQLHDCLRMVLRPSAHTPAEAAPLPPMIAPTRSPGEGQNPDRPRVLLAEDNRTNQIATVRMLQILGYQVDVAINGIEAVEACRNVDYQIVLMDNQMPEMDGLTAASEVRTLELARGKPPVPIIALTANAMAGDREKCLAAGMTDYLTKPFRLEQLRTMLEGWGHVLPVVAAARLRQEPAIDSKVFEEFRTLGADSGANNFVTELIDQYLAESTSRMATLKDAAKHGDAPALRRVTHSLRGSSGTVGAHRMAELCRDLETLARGTTLDGSLAMVTALEDEFERVGLALYAELRSA